MAVVRTKSTTLPWLEDGKALVICGVSTSEPVNIKAGDHPIPDYSVLFEAIQSDVIDVDNIKDIRHPVIAGARRMLGLQWAIGLAALQRASQYQVVLATGEDVGLPFAWLLKFFKLQIPLIIICHNVASRRPGFFLKYLNVGRYVRTFQCLSKAQAKTLLSYPGISYEKIQIINWHVDHHFFSPMSNVPILNQVCSAGMASRDYATLLLATQDLDVDVKIAADSPWFNQKLNISSEGLSPRVEVRSYRTYLALRQLYAESRLVVVPLLDVPYSAGYTVILEAMAMGKAVIVSRIKQQDDFIIDGWNGSYVTPGDVSELRAKIAFLLERPDEISRLGANARRTVEDRFTLQHFVEQMKEGIAHSTGPTPVPYCS